MITPNLLSISTDTAHIPMGVTIRFHLPETGKQTLMPKAMEKITLRHHKGAFVGCFSLRLKKNTDWDLFKKWKENRNPSITDQMAGGFLPFIRNHYALITTAPPSANRCPHRYCVHDLAKAISGTGRPGSPLSRPFLQKQTNCTMAVTPASTNRNQYCWNPGTSKTDPSFSWMTASPPVPQPDSAMKPW